MQFPPKMQFRDKEQGYILLLMCLLLHPTICPPISEERDTHDLCSALRNDHIYNLEENASLQLILHSSDVNDKLMLWKLKKKCNVIVKACPACHILVEISNMTIPSCSGDCNCNGFQISEPLSDYTGQNYCGIKKKPMYYQSQTKTIYLDFVQSVHMKFYVSLTFNVSRNVFIFAEDLSPFPKYVETPHFPMAYPSDYGAEYIFQAQYPMGIVQLLFIDFQLSKNSMIEISGHNGTHTAVFSGGDGRPPVITSQSPTLKVSFRANECPSNRGFRAQYIFGRKSGDFALEKPQTRCGGVKEGFGGTISLTTANEDLFDCIWLIHPPLFKSKLLFLSIFVLNFSRMGINSTLEIRDGPTSKSNLIKTQQYEDLNNYSSHIVPSEVVMPVVSGVYIRFHGYLTKINSIKLSYFIFHEEECSNDEYSCINNRCIKNVLLCDGFSNCPDSGDEMLCSDHISTAVELNISTSSSITKVALLSSKKVTAVVVVCSFAGVISMLAILYVVITLTTKTSTTRERQAGLLNTLSDNGYEPEPHLSPAPVINPLFSNLYQNYDTPPSYDDVMAFNYRYPPLTYSHGNYHSETTSVFHDDVISPYEEHMIVENRNDTLRFREFHDTLEDALSSFDNMEYAASVLPRSLSFELKRNEIIYDLSVSINRYSSLPAKLDFITK